MMPDYATESGLKKLFGHRPERQTIMQKTWEYLSGKKTNIGAGLLFAAVVIAKLSGIWEISPEWLPHVIETLQWFGTLLAGTGLAHKSVKSIQS